MLNLGQCSFDFLLSGGWRFVETGQDVVQPCLVITIIVDRFDICLADDDLSGRVVLHLDLPEEVVA